MSYQGNTPAEKYQTLQKQSFTTSATDTYTLSYSVTNPQDLGLFINNVRQNPNDAYTVSGTTLTLSSAITSSDTMYAVFLGRAVETIAPATGSVTNAMLAGSIATSKLADGSTFATTNGITEADQFVITSSLSVSSEVTISANLTRNANSGFSQIGTGMSHSSGLFSFPSTGMYYISAVGDWYSSNTPNYCGLYISMTTDNGSSFSTANNNANITSGNHYANSKVQALFNCTNTSTHKVRFRTTAGATSNLQGSSTAILTNFLFIRLGDSQ
tara:strand:- start:385 stop:1197 length:813 start_codon:yes stop_codon:yes gene_type:complete